MTVMLPTYNIAKTILCTYNELGVIVPLNSIYFLDTTLNHKYNLFPNSVPSNTPKIKYFGIGVKGYKNLDNQQLAAPYVPKPTNMDLYDPIPIKIVPVADDLTSEERAKYRLRVKQNINGQDYWCYYLKLLDYQSTNVKLIQTDLKTKLEEEITELDPTNLTPTPTDVSTTGYVSYETEQDAVADAIITITGEEVLESISIIKNDMLPAVRVSEIGLYSGEDLNVTIDNVNYTEAIYSQLAYHITSLGDDMSNPSNTVSRTIRLSSASSFLV